MKKPTIDKIKDLIIAIGNRQVGNTTLMMKGTENYDRPYGVISHSVEYSEDLLSRNKSELGKGFSINNLDAIKETQIPVLIDNAALVHFLESVVKDMENSITKEDAKKLMDPIMEMAEIYQDRSHQLEQSVLSYMLCPWWAPGRRREMKDEMLEKIKGFHGSKKLNKIFDNFRNNLKG
jgi:hypothetical protein